MRDYLGRNQMWNTFPKNPTQNAYSRFLKTPQGEIRTAFTDSIDLFDSFKKPHETVYNRLIGDI